MKLKKIIVGPLAVNCYIVGCTKTNQAAVIDPGDDVEKIIKTLNQELLVLKYILLTHGHVDHVTQLMKLKQATNAEILMHHDDVFLFENISAQAALFGLPNPGDPTPDRYLIDGDKIYLGEIQIRVLHTPGHSPGSLTFQIEKNLIVGDLIFYGSIGRTDLPGGNYETLIQSVQQIIFTFSDDTNILPGHGPVTTVGTEKKFNPFFS